MANMTITIPIREGRPLSDMDAPAPILAEQLNKPERVKKSCQLMDLPTELLWQILEIIVVKPRSQGKYQSTIDLFQTDCVHHTCKCRARYLSEQPGILRTCRLFRHEGLHLFYSKNIFRSRDADKKLFQALNVIGREQASKMRILIDVEFIFGDYHQLDPVYNDWKIQVGDLLRDACGATPSLVVGPWSVRILTRQNGKVVFFNRGFIRWGFSRYYFVITVGDYCGSTTDWTTVADLAAAYAAKKPSQTQYDSGFYVEEPIAKLMSI